MPYSPLAVIPASRLPSFDASDASRLQRLQSSVSPRSPLAEGSKSVPLLLTPSLPSASWTDRLREWVPRGGFGLGKSPVFRFLHEATTGLVISLVGLVMAGLVLDAAQHWNVFTKVTELLILVPTLLNLKGNLEMNFAARLSVASHIDNFSRDVIVGNIALMELQAIVCSVVSGLWSFLLATVRNIEPDAETARKDNLLVVAVAVVSGSVSTLISAATITAVITLSRRLHLDPDNIATPIAASFGDLTAVLFLAGTAYLLGLVIDTPISLIVLVIFLLPLPMLLVVVMRNKEVRSQVGVGWTPLLMSLVISTGAGLALEGWASRFRSLALLSPVLSGVMNNVASIHSSRLNTRLVVESSSARSAPAAPDANSSKTYSGVGGGGIPECEDDDSVRASMSTLAASDDGRHRTEGKASTNFTRGEIEIDIEDAQEPLDTLMRSEDDDDDEDLLPESPTSVESNSMSDSMQFTLLMLTHLAVQFLFILSVFVFNMGRIGSTFSFLPMTVTYVGCATVALFVLLLISQALTRWTFDIGQGRWTGAVLPVVSAVGDVLGTSMLIFGLWVLSRMA